MTKIISASSIIVMSFLFACIALSMTTVDAKPTYEHKTPVPQQPKVTVTPAPKTIVVTSTKTSTATTTTPVTTTMTSTFTTTKIEVETKLAYQSAPVPTPILVSTKDNSVKGTSGSISSLKFNLTNPVSGPKPSLNSTSIKNKPPKNAYATPTPSKSLSSPIMNQTPTPSSECQDNSTPIPASTCLVDPVMQPTVAPITSSPNEIYAISPPSKTAISEGIVIRVPICSLFLIFFFSLFY